MKTCKSIKYILKITELEGNFVLNVSNSELMDKVIWMNNKLSDFSRKQIKEHISDLVFHITKDMPHNPGTESYICLSCKTVISFPLRTAK